MRLSGFLALAVAWACAVQATSNNLTSLVTWDKYSLSISGTRVFINSAEFHYQRLPVPELWLDVFQKLKANGFNTVSIYFFWSYHSPAKGVFDFESPGKNVQRLFDAAKEAGLWVIARAGPYCNAETNGGGLALWGSDGSLGKLRTGDETYHQAWLPWISAIGKIIAKNQITNGGPVIMNQIENELEETAHSATHTRVVYMQQVEAAFRDAGVVVPSTGNEKGMRWQSWSTDYQNVGGAVDLYGLDSYPGGLSCTNPNAGFRVARNYHQWFANYSFTQPSFLPEFEGGWFSGWGAAAFYDQCKTEHGPNFADVYYKNNIGQRVTLQSIYMAFGGTNWGHSAAPVVYTSYDYRQQWDKLFQTKLVNMFSGSTPDLLKTDMVGNGAGFRVSSAAVFTWALRNPDTGATFAVVQQTDSTSTANVTFSATLDTSAGAVTVPNVSLHGRQSKILATNYRIGGGRGPLLLYASADIATSAAFDDGSAALVLYLDEGQTAEFAFKASDADLHYTVSGSSAVTASPANGTTPRQVFTYTQGPGVTTVKLSSNLLVYLLDRPTAWRFWAPQVAAAAPASPFIAPDGGGRIFVLGPYLVRGASVDRASSTLHISGDIDLDAAAAPAIEVYAGAAVDVHTITWNGAALAATKTSYGAYTATIPAGAADGNISLPSLEDAAWVSADALPEAGPDYDDSRWTVCDKATTRSPVAPATLPVLFSSDYGHYAGAKIYRGYFPSPPPARGSNAVAAAAAVNITASGGLAFGWSAWLNGHHVGGHRGNGSQGTTWAVLPLPAAALKDPGGGGSRPAAAAAAANSNVLTVVVDYHGHDETSTASGLLNPRGLLGAALLLPDAASGRDRPAGAGAGFSAWKMAGPVPAALDPVRGPMNEGGLHPERMGWHLPGFVPGPTASFAPSSPLAGLSAAGIHFYVANFTLALPVDLDVPLGIELGSPEGTVARVMLWVNGYLYGKFVPHIGPQTMFPVPPGVVRNRGVNTIALTIWAQTDAGARLDKVHLVAYGKYQTSFAFAGLGQGDVAPAWADNRSAYA